MFEIVTLSLWIIYSDVALRQMDSTLTSSFRMTGEEGQRIAFEVSPLWPRLLRETGFTAATALTQTAWDLVKTRDDLLLTWNSPSVMPSEIKGSISAIFWEKITAAASASLLRFVKLLAKIYGMSVNVLFNPSFLSILSRKWFTAAASAQLARLVQLCPGGMPVDVSPPRIVAGRDIFSTPARTFSNSFIFHTSESFSIVA